MSMRLNRVRQLRTIADELVAAGDGTVARLVYYAAALLEMDLAVEQAMRTASAAATNAVEASKEAFHGAHGETPEQIALKACADQLAALLED